MKSFISCVAFINKYFVAFEKALIAALLLSMIFLSFGQVLARNVFSSGFIWIDQVLRLEVLWVAFLGAALATEYNQHIKIDFLASITRSDTSKKIIGASAHIFAFFICCLLFIVSSDYIRIVSSDSTSTNIHGIPDWYFQLIIPYCFFFVSIRTGINVFKIFHKSSLN